MIFQCAEALSCRYSGGAEVSLKPKDNFLLKQPASKNSLTAEWSNQARAANRKMPINMEFYSTAREKVSGTLDGAHEWRKEYLDLRTNASPRRPTLRKGMTFAYQAFISTELQYPLGTMYYCIIGNLRITSQE